MPINVAIVEDRVEVRENWAGVLQAAPDMNCVGVCASAEEALVKLPPLKPHVVLMDLNLPDMNGAECTRRLRLLIPEAQILVVTAYSDNQRVFEALESGANGYLLKRTPSEELLAAIVDVTQGGVPMTAEIARRVLEAFHRPAPVQETMELSERETEILQLVAQGYGNKEVADRLALSFETVRTRLKRIYEKLHVRSRAGATSKYLQSASLRRPIARKDP